MVISVVVSIWLTTVASGTVEDVCRRAYLWLIDLWLVDGTIATRRRSSGEILLIELDRVDCPEKRSGQTDSPGCRRRGPKWCVVAARARPASRAARQRGRAPVVHSAEEVSPSIHVIARPVSVVPKESRRCDGSLPFRRGRDCRTSRNAGSPRAVAASSSGWHQSGHDRLLSSARPAAWGDIEVAHVQARERQVHIVRTFGRYQANRRACVEADSLGDPIHQDDWDSQRAATPSGTSSDADDAGDHLVGGMDPDGPGL